MFNTQPGLNRSGLLPWWLVAMDVDRVQGAKGKGKKGKNDDQQGKGKDAKGKGKKGKGDQKGKEGDRKGKGKGKDQKGKSVTTCYTCGQVASDQARSSSGGASLTTHTVGQQHASFVARQRPNQWSAELRIVSQSVLI